MNESQRKKYEKYLNKGFDDDQLYEIRIGIEQGYDISAYARLSISAEDMSHIRKSMNYRKKMESQMAEAQIKKEEKPKPVRKKTVHAPMTTEKMLNCSIVAGVISIIAAVLVIASRIN